MADSPAAAATEAASPQTPLPDEERDAREARSETRRAVVAELEAVLYREFPVLDRSQGRGQGFIRVVDYMGSDAAVVQAARVSYGTGTRRRSDDRGLIRYLLRRRHTTPFEMCEIKLHVKAPIFVARQWLRHRTANVNEYSARYSRLDREFYVPDAPHLQTVLEKQVGRQRESRRNMHDMFPPAGAGGAPEQLAAQSETNRQGRGSRMTRDDVETILSRIAWLSRNAYGVYENLLKEDETGKPRDPDRPGLARELARAVLPVNYYTQFYWKIDLHNLLHFLSLRADPHAQYEIRAYAEVILDEIVRRWVPVTHEAFEDYVRNAVSLSAGAAAVLRELLDDPGVGARLAEMEARRGEPGRDFGLSDREWREIVAALRPIG